MATRARPDKVEQHGGLRPPIWFVSLGLLWTAGTVLAELYHGESTLSVLLTCGVIAAGWMVMYVRGVAARTWRWLIAVAVAVALASFVSAALTGIGILTGFTITFVVIFGTLFFYLQDDSSLRPLLLALQRLPRRRRNGVLALLLLAGTLVGAMDAYVQSKMPSEGERLLESLGRDAVSPLDIEGNRQLHEDLERTRKQLRGE